MRFDIVTIFPGMFASVFAESIIKKAVDSGVIEIHLHDVRKWTTDRHSVTDDSPYGGGPGMVMKVEPFARAVEELRELNEGAKVALLTPQGEIFTQRKAVELSGLPGLVLLCGRYEGVDERVRQSFCDMEISIGDYVVTGGEIPAMAVVDAVARLVPGVLGDERSSVEESHSNYLLEYPQYTRPAEFRGLKTPEVLLSGHHAQIEQWRKKQAIERTAQKRPDLLSRAELTDEERKIARDILENKGDSDPGG